jgi:hypothetical protein
MFPSTLSNLQDGLKTLILSVFGNLLHYSQKVFIYNAKSSLSRSGMQVFTRISVLCQLIIRVLTSLCPSELHFIPSANLVKQCKLNTYLTQEVEAISSNIPMPDLSFNICTCPAGQLVHSNTAMSLHILETQEIQQDHIFTLVNENAIALPFRLMQAFCFGQLQVMRQHKQSSNARASIMLLQINNENGSSVAKELKTGLSSKGLLCKGFIDRLGS